MKQVKSSTRIAGVDVGKRRLDVAVHGSGEAAVFANDPAGVAALVDWLKAREVGRVGLEATGGYERSLREAASGAGLEVVVHQPLEVRLFAKLKRVKAKTDKMDAVIIAAATAQVDTVRAAADPRLAELAERLTAYEQFTDPIVLLKTQLEHVTLADITELFERQIQGLELCKANLLKSILTAVGAHDDLAGRLKLLRSLPGCGPVVAVSLLVRMPELGSLEPGQAASLLGVAPFTRESGQYKGHRFIGGGRSRPRRMVYLASLAARRCSPQWKAFAQKLADRGKPPKLILAAIMRKLIEAANLVLKRGVAWERDIPAKDVHETEPACA